MTDQIEKSFYFNKSELGLLLDSIDCSSINCLDIFGKNVDITAQEAYKSLYQMINEGVITIEEESFSVSDDVNEIISSISSAQKVLVVYSNEFSIIAVYKNRESFVLSQLNRQRNNKIKFSIENKSEIANVIIEKFKLDGSGKILIDKEIDKNISDMFISSLAMLNLDDDFSEAILSDRVAAVLDFRDLTENKLYEKVIIVKQPDNPFMLIWKKDSVEKLSFSKESFEKEIKNNFLEL